MAAPSLPRASVNPHVILMTVVAEVIFVIILSMIASSSPMAETVVVTFLSGLWLAYLVNNGSTLIAYLDSKIGSK
jgi:hypothetical protein